MMDGKTDGQMDGGIHNIPIVFFFFFKISMEMIRA